MKTILLAIVVLGALGALFGAILAFAAKIFHVEVDPKQEAVRGVRELLSHSVRANRVRRHGKRLHGHARTADLPTVSAGGPRPPFFSLPASGRNQQFTRNGCAQRQRRDGCQSRQDQTLPCCV